MARKIYIGEGRTDGGLAHNSVYNLDRNVQQKILKRFSMFDSAGFDLTGCDTYDEALEEAGLDYTAEKKSLFIMDDENNPIEVAGNFAFVKSNEPSRVLGIMGNQYTPVGNRDAFAVAEEIVDEGLARYEVGGPSLGAQKTVDYGKSFLVLRGDDFKIGEDEFQSFTYFNNSFDGSSGVLNRNTELLIGTKYTEKEFVSTVIPQILKTMKLVEKDKERERGHERVERVVDQLMGAWRSDDVQNYAGTAYRVLLALSDFESHSEPLKNTNNSHVYLNRITKGMALTTAALTVIESQKKLGLFRA